MSEVQQQSQLTMCNTLSLLDTRPPYVQLPVIHVLYVYYYDCGVYGTLL